MRACVVLLILSIRSSSANIVADQQKALLQTWDSTLSNGKDTPITRVVNLLKDMQATLNKEMEEDEALYKELSCWCNDNNWEKGNAIEAGTSKISELESTIESLTAKSAALNNQIKELNDQVAADKQALAEATEQRKKQQQAFHGEELDSIQALENLKAALVILSKHHSGAFPQLSLLATGKDEPWTSESDRMAHSLDEFMRTNGFADVDVGATSSHKFLQQDTPAPTHPSLSGWSSKEVSVVKRALKSASAFVQAHNGEAYYPSYNAQSGEIVGVLKQLQDEMTADLSESQQREVARAKTFEELRAAKTEQIESNHKMAEQKEDELADTDNNLAEAKEDLQQEEATLTANQKFVANLKAQCGDAEKNFEARKVARLEEIKAVTDTIEILTADEARDAMTGTYSLVQVSSKRQDKRRMAAAAKLRGVAAKLHGPQFSALATSVELDAFTRVKKAIDDMIAKLKVEQADEVKKNDYCKNEFQENEMATMKAQDLKSDLEAKSAVLEENIKALVQGIADAKAAIAQSQADFQKASEDRVRENHDFQKTVADQTVVIEVLKKALDKLAKHYDFVQVQQKKSKQTPPVPQKEYKPSKGASGVMELIEKLIHEAKELMATSKHDENVAQAAYEQLVADTNASLKALQQEVVTKTKEKAQATKDKSLTDSDIADTDLELEGLAKTNSDLHAECDYVQKNFDARQTARSQEIEALQQAKQILNGASLS